MGAKTSKSELTRRKSFTNLGRSSQRSLFQKSKLALNRISKQIDSAEVNATVAALDVIKNDLDGVEKDLDGISDTVKVKNQEKYDEVCRHLANTRKKYKDKFNIRDEPNPVEDTNEIILRNPAVETSNEVINYSEEPKKLCVTFRESGEEVHFEEPKRPSVKFGVQVLPPSPQQVLLKRKTYPTNSPPKSDFNRNTTDGSFPHFQNGTSSRISIQTSNSFNSKTISQNSQYSSVSIQSSGRQEFLKSNSILGIDAINNEINELENKLKYFTGSKNSKRYVELHKGFVNNLALLESIDTAEDPITKQEKKILSQRINELLKILECIVEQVNGDCDEHLSLAYQTNESFEEHPRLLSSVTAI